MPAQMRRKVMVGTSVFGLVMVLGIVGYGVLTNGSMLVALLSALLLIPVLIVGARLGVRRQDEAHQSLRIRLTERQLTRTMKGYPELTLLRDEVTLLREVPAGLALIPRDRQRTVFVPNRLQGYEELRSLLRTWAPKTTADQGMSGTRMGMLLAMCLLPAACMLAAFSAETRAVVLVAGTFALLSLGACAWSISRSPNAARGDKRTAIWLVPMLLSLVWRMWSFW